MRWILVILAVVTVSACGVSANQSGSGSALAAASEDPRKAAIQKSLDDDIVLARRNSKSIFRGTSCKKTDFQDFVFADKFVGTPGVTVSKHFVQAGDECVKVTWDSHSGAHFATPTEKYGYVPLGHFVVTKVGEDQMLNGQTAAPYNAHFELTPVGKAFAAKKIGRFPRDITDGTAIFHKDANGTLVAN
jgi:hypothetical protein